MNSIFFNRIGFSTLFSREIHRFMKISVQTLIAPLISNILYLAIFGGMLNTRSVNPTGVSYLQFIVPGLVSMGAIFAALQNPSSSIISQKYNNTFQELNSYPISNAEKTLAYVLAGTIRGILVGSLTYVLTGFFVGFGIDSPFLFFFMLALTSFIFSAFSLICGLYINTNEKLNFILSIVVTPLTYLGGVFFEISKLPGLLSYSRFINPMYPLISLERYAYLGVTDGNPAYQAIIVVAIAVILFIMSQRSIKKGVGLKIV